MEDIWAITAYFNPVGYARRPANYRVFRERLQVPLVAVELAYGPEFELCDGDADILVQLRCTDVMWQKERLLNVALRVLPASCDKVVWMDCDVVFGSDDWPERASRRLDEVALLQPFSHVHDMPKGPISGAFRAADAESTRLAMAASGVPAGTWTPEFRPRSGLGLAWAARREILDAHGFYDACIVGGGDRAITAAADGSFFKLMETQQMNAAQRRRYLTWAEAFHADIGGVTACLDGDLFHLWHGNANNRFYRERHARLKPFRFDPFVDIAIAENGSWRWNSDKPDMHGYVREYFSSRREDS